MDRRVELHEIFTGLINVDNVYFQPPPTLSIEYPCIIYNIDPSWTKHANNSKYVIMRAYQVTVIDRDPESHISKQIETLPMTNFNRRFMADGLNHDVFTLYF